MKAIDWDKQLVGVDDDKEWRYVGPTSRGRYVVERMMDGYVATVNEYGYNGIIHEIKNVVQKHTAWCNFYPLGSGGVHQTREDADLNALVHRIACIQVEFEEGDGL